MVERLVTTYPAITKHTLDALLQKGYYKHELVALPIGVDGDNHYYQSDKQVYKVNIATLHGLILPTIRNILTSGGLVLKQRKYNRTIMALIGIILIAITLHLVFVERLTSKPLFPMPADKNRSNNFVANPEVWMVGDKLHLSNDKATLQASEKGYLRRMHGKNMIATVTDDYYLYAYIDSGDSAYFALDVKLQRLSDRKIIFNEEGISSPFLTEEYLYYIAAYRDNEKLMRFSLQTGETEELLPYVAAFCVVDNILLYSDDTYTSLLTSMRVTNRKPLRYIDLETGKRVDFTDTPIKSIYYFFVDDHNIYFQNGEDLLCMNTDSKALRTVLTSNDVRLLNVYNGKLYLAYLEHLEFGSYNCEVRSRDAVSGAEMVLLPEAKVAWSPNMTVLDDNVYIYYERDSFGIYNRGETYIKW